MVHKHNPTIQSLEQAERFSWKQLLPTSRSCGLSIDVREQLVWHILLDLLPMFSVLDCCQLTYHASNLKDSLTFLAKYVSKSGIAL